MSTTETGPTTATDGPDVTGKSARRRGVVERYVDSVTSRTGGGSWLTKNLRKVFPNHFSFLWGELALYSFVVLILTGTYLTLFFEGSQETLIYSGSYDALRGQEVSAAFDSVMRISFETKGGLLIRQMHHWAALIFVGAIALHLARVYFTGAFRRPRDLNWFVGIGLLLLALGAGFTGYSLPDDLLSGTGLRITYAIILSLPFIGERLTYLIFGGEWPGTDIIGRLYPVHIMIIPGLIIGLLAVHLGLVWHQKHTQFKGPGRTEGNVVGERVWPAFAMKSIGLFFLTAAVITAMGALFDINAIWLYGPYDAAQATSFAQPDWYIGFLEGSVRLFPPWEIRIGNYMINTLVFSAVLIPGLIFTGLALVPLIERKLTGDDRDHHLLDRPRDAPNRTAIGAASIFAVGVLFLGGAQDVVADTFDISVGRVTTVLQVLFLIGPPITWYVTRRSCLALQDRTGPERTERRVPIVRDAGGGYEEPESDDDWMDHGGAAPGHFDGTSDAHRVRGASHRSDSADDVEEVRPVIAPTLLRQLEPPLTEQAETVDDVWTLFLWIGFGVLAMVVALVVWIMLRYRRRSDDLPPQKHYNIPMEIAYTVIPFVVVVALFALTVVTVNAIEGTDDDPDLVVHVTAYQWSWEFEYPQSGVVIVDSSDVADPELVLPASSTIRFDLESVDVVHSFWLTAFRFKRDMIPGSPSNFRVDMDGTTGYFPNAGVCAEFCGLDHARMRFSVRVLPPDEFDAWLTEQLEAAT